MATNISKLKAILTLKPNAQFQLADDVLTWNDKVQTEPTQAEIDAEVTRLQAEYDAQEYARKRQAEYPPWNEQLDKIFHDGVAKWKSEMVQPVKDKYPKPE